MMKLIILVMVLTLLIGGVLIFGTPGKSGEIEVNPLEYELGDVSMAEGLIHRTFEIKNTGEEELEITSVWTSCMCTTARLRVGDKTSPEFSMNSSSMLWSQKINPGQSGTLEVVFDPALHGPEGTGEVVRTIQVSSSDPEARVVKLKLTGNVIQ